MENNQEKRHFQSDENKDTTYEISLGGGKTYVVKDKRVHVPDEVIASLIMYAEEERRMQNNPVIAEMITWRSLANHILLNEVQKRGYYKRKGR